MTLYDNIQSLKMDKMMTLHNAKSYFVTSITIQLFHKDGCSL